mmetsp:Transcript_188/g.359  ORF Transcript_188/g.359 Transcript_188/m.359 type:complete len:337 (+) Transcript_188:118-1128(+)
MSISFESAVETLKTMFPDWDEETLSTILVSNNYHVEQTIETVLSMGGGEDSPPPSGSAAPAPAPGPTPAPAPANNAPERAPTQGSYQTSGAGNTGSPPSSSSQNGNSRYRGLKVELPADFLRPPNHTSSQMLLADEELALMLQNEMFQSQARELLGEEFMRDDNGGSASRRGSNANANAASGGTNHRQASAAGDNNLGIMNSLSSMGSAAKRNLTQLAQAFKSSGGGSGGGGGRGSGAVAPDSSSGAGGGTNSRRGSGAGTQGTHTRRGLRDFEDEDEDGTEIITFNGADPGRGRHVLDGGGRNAEDDDDDDDPFDSENPLLQYNNNSNMAARKNN